MNKSRSLQQTLDSGQFFGRCVQQFQGREFGFYEYEYAADTTVPKHAHKHALVSFLISGEYVERFGKNERKSPNRVVYHPPQEEHSEWFGNTGARLFGFHVPDELLDYLRDSTALIQDPCENLGLLDTVVMIRILRSLSENSPIGVLAAEAMALELLGKLPTRRVPIKESRRPKWISHAQELLDSDKDFSLKLSSISRICELSPGYVSREFRRWHGCSVGEYVSRRRVALAFQQIRESDANFATIAATAGFSDQSHLSRAIKRTVGMTPCELRRNARRPTRSKRS
jgi:AraC family transcriptional regulator